MKGRSNTRRRAAVLVLAVAAAIACAHSCRPPEGNGRITRTIGKEGWFRLAQAEDGTWWFLDPSGRRHVSIGINHIEPALLASESNRNVFSKKYGEDLVGQGGWPDPTSQAARRWMGDAMDQVSSWGFNTIGVHNPIPQDRMPYVATFRPAAIDGWAKLDRRYPDPWDPETAKVVAARAGEWCAANASDRLIVGVSFNDMPIWRSAPGAPHEWVSTIMALGPGAAGKAEWVGMLKGRYPDAAAAAGVYGVEAASWDDLAGRAEWPDAAMPLKAYDDGIAFLALIADEWYGLVSGSIRSCDPNHLVFGDKLEGARDMPAWIYPIAGRHFDLAFVQWYAHADVQAPRLEELHEVTGEPVLMGDSSFSAPTARMPAPKGVHVPSQAEVGEAYATYLETVLAMPFVVGWHHCGYIEGSPDLAGIHPYLAIQNGFLTPEGVPHEATVADVSAANAKAEAWHRSPTPQARGASDPAVMAGRDGWRRCETARTKAFHFTRIDNNVFVLGGVGAGKSRVPVKNISWIVTDEGVVVIDTGYPASAGVAKAVMRSTTSRPVAYIVYTHHHGTQIAGTRSIADQGTKVVAHEDLVLELDLARDFYGYNAMRDSIQFDTDIPAVVPDWVYPDETYSVERRIDLGGTTIELRHAVGEADDYTIVFLPAQRIAFVGDMVGPSLPMIGSPMKQVRDEVKWRKAVAMIEGLNPAILVGAVGTPDCVQSVVDDRLAAYDAYLAFLHAAVASAMNDGLTLEEALARIVLPDDLARSPYLPEGYGANVFNVSGLYHEYSGWFDRNGTHLDPAPAASVASSFVAAMGGSARVLAKAGALADDGEDELALEYLDLIIGADDGNEDAHALKGRILMRLSIVHWKNPIVRNMYTSLAEIELEKGGVAPAGEAATDHGRQEMPEGGAE